MSHVASPAASQAACQAPLRAILECGDLETKLAPIPEGPAAEASRAACCDPIEIERPRRGPGLEMAPGAESLPRPAALRDPAARVRCIARFAHHELQAVELLAWALLRWPALPESLQRGLRSVLADEQRHTRLYLERLAAHGADLNAYAPHSDYFWKHAPAMAAGGPPAFLAALGLTLEQANLDFTVLYRDGFREAGDEDTARVLEQVHADEVGHVAVAARGLRRLMPGHADDLARYEAAVPFPLSAARAKGRRFEEAARRRAGLDEDFIQHVRQARPSRERTGDH